MYLLSTSGYFVTWEKARTLCEDLDTNSWLAMTRTSDQASAFKKLLTQRKVNLQPRYAWIGLYRKDDSGQVCLIL